MTKDDLADFKQEMMNALNQALQMREMRETVTPPTTEITQDVEEPKSPTAFKLEVELEYTEKEKGDEDEAPLEDGEKTKKVA